MRQRPEFKDIMNSTQQYNKYRNMQLNQLDNIKRELETKRAKPQSIESRNKMLAYRDKVNYQNEIDRIRGYLSQNDTRFPIGDLARLRKRAQDLKKLIQNIV